MLRHGRFDYVRCFLLLVLHVLSPLAEEAWPACVASACNGGSWFLSLSSSVLIAVFSLLSFFMSRSDLAKSVS